ncbi:MAG: GTP 3',8-cyclase MoaA, partial [Actinomycetota bacterium]|nr:GTP 3',8-cyclase MoaA [Actinomycetota bacterium]
AVALRGFTEDEVLPFARFAREHPFEVRFIEFMPLDADESWTPDSVLSGPEIRAAIGAEFGLVEEEREASATARTYRFADGTPGRLGFIDPVSHPFCSDCNRIRLTADGRLRTCLFSLGETDLLGVMRAGASDDELETVLRDAVWRKELKHRVNEQGFQQPARTMSAIGG